MTLFLVTDVLVFVFPNPICEAVEHKTSYKAFMTALYIKSA